MYSVNPSDLKSRDGTVTRGIGYYLIFILLSSPSSIVCVTSRLITWVLPSDTPDFDHTSKHFQNETTSVKPVNLRRSFWLHFKWKSRHFSFVFERVYGDIRRRLSIGDMIQWWNFKSFSELKHNGGFTDRGTVDLRTWYFRDFNHNCIDVMKMSSLYKYRGCKRKQKI